MIEKYLEDYYKGKINKDELSRELGLSSYKMDSLLKSKGLLTFNKHLDKLNFKNEQLKKILVGKYQGIRARCSGKQMNRYQHVYNGLEYLNVIDWVAFCNDNSRMLNSMWEEYVSENKNIKYAISIDRVNNDEGYLVNNMQFITHGCNSWKRSIDRPIRAKLVGCKEWKYFMSCAEGCRFYNLRDKDFGEILNNNMYHNNYYSVQHSTIEDVLRENKCKTIEEYYNKFIK